MKFELEVVKFDVNDVITTSLDDGKKDDNELPEY